ncbi:MAG: lamin tail domain-containing protein [Myxococcota bacterium]
MRSILVCTALLGTIACQTQDVEEPPPPAELYPLSDAAFGEYMAFLKVPGISSEQVDGETVWSVDINLVDGVAELALSKTSSAVANLKEAGVATAADKIVDLDGIQFFVNLELLRITANDVESLDLANLQNLQALEMNFNLVGDLDLTNNAVLDRLRYQGSSQAEDGQRLQTIDLSGNPALRHLSLPNHELVTIDLQNNPLIDETLDLSGNPGPDGDPDTPDIVVPSAIYDQVPEEMRLGVVSDADVGLLVSISASVVTIAESGETVTITATANSPTESEVTVDLGLSGTATLGDDFTAGPTTLTIPAGELTASTTLTSVDDDEAEGIEIIEVTLDRVTGGELGFITELEVTIADDDIDPGLTINEVLYDPSNDPADDEGNFPGDANGDGIYVQDEDEFVEFVNTSGGVLDVSNYAIWDTEAWVSGVPRHVIPAGTVLEDGGVLVVFGGGTPSGAFGGAQVQTTTTGAINLNNSGDLLRITDDAGLIVLQFDVEPLSNNPNESYTRNPDLTGDFEQHAANSDLLFSPGTRVDGSSF